MTSGQGCSPALARHLWAGQREDLLGLNVNCLESALDVWLRRGWGILNILLVPAASLPNDCRSQELHLGLSMDGGSSLTVGPLSAALQSVHEEGARMKLSRGVVCII